MCACVCLSMYMFSLETHVSFSYVLDNPSRVVSTEAGSVRGFISLIICSYRLIKLTITQKVRMVSKKAIDNILSIFWSRTQMNNYIQI